MATVLTGWWTQCPESVMTIEYPISTPNVITIAAGQYKGAYELGLAIHAALQAVSANLSFYVNSDYKYQLDSSSGNFHVTGLGTAYQHIGLDFSTATTSKVMEQDRHLWVASGGYQEDIPGERHSGQLETSGAGYTSGRPSPSGSEKQSWSMRFLTEIEDTHPAVTAANARRLMNSFHAGTPMRVYRNWTDKGAWSTSNTDGYSDLITVATSGSDYPWWGTTTRGRYKVEIEGVEV